MEWIILILITAFVFAKIYENSSKYKKRTRYKQPLQQPIESNEDLEEQQIDYAKSYAAKYLLTKNEWYEHKKLQNIAEKKGLIICPKVRLLDIIEPRRSELNYLKLLHKIQAKHVDFLICDKAMHIKAVLELDDNSHNNKERQERDFFVDQILTSVGYKVIRTRSITETTLNCLNDTKEDKTHLN